MGLVDHNYLFIPIPCQKPDVCTFCERQSPHIHFSWPTGCEWHCTFCDERQSHHIFYYDQQLVSDSAHVVKGSLITFFLLPTASEFHDTFCERDHIFTTLVACEWHCTFCEGHTHHISSYNQQLVSDIVHFVEGSLISSFLIKKQVSDIAHFCERGSHDIFSYDQQVVSDIAHFVNSHLFLSPTESEWQSWTFYEKQSHHIFSYDQQEVSDIEHFVKGSVITSFPITNREWVTFHVLWKAVSLHLFLWLIDGEWHWTVSESSVITAFPITNSEWVTLHILWKETSSHIFPIINSLWVTLHICEEDSHELTLLQCPTACGYIAHSVKGSLIAVSYDRPGEWVTLHILWKAASSLFHMTGCEWHCTFCERSLVNFFLWQQYVSDIGEKQSHHILSYNQQHVSDIIAHFVKDSLTHLPYDPQVVSDSPHFGMTFSSHPFPQPSACEWHWTSCERQSHHCFPWQAVSDIAHFVKGVLSIFSMTNSMWVTLHILWKAVSSQFVISPTGCEWDCTSC